MKKCIICLFFYYQVNKVPKGKRPSPNESLTKYEERVVYELKKSQVLDKLEV